MGGHCHVFLSHQLAVHSDLLSNIHPIKIEQQLLIILLHICQSISTYSLLPSFTSLGVAIKSKTLGPSIRLLQYTNGAIRMRPVVKHATPIADLSCIQDSFEFV